MPGIHWNEIKESYGRPRKTPPSNNVETREATIIRLKKSIMEKRRNHEPLTAEETAVVDAEINENRDEIEKNRGVH